MAELFSKIKQGIGKGIATASVRSKEVLESTKVHSQLRELREQKRGLLEELGNIAYTMFLKGEFDEARLNCKCASIGVRDEEIIQKEEVLREIHAKAEEALGKPKPVAVCFCGSELYDGTKFCGKCGTKVQTAS